MLDFLDFLTNRFSLKAEMDGYFRRVANLSAEDCRYLLIMHNHKKTFLLESEIYLGLLSFFGTNGLKTFANYAKRHLEKHSSDNKEHTEYILSQLNHYLA